MRSGCGAGLGSDDVTALPFSGEVVRQARGVTVSGVPPWGNRPAAYTKKSTATRHADAARATRHAEARFGSGRAAQVLWMRARKVSGMKGIALFRRISSENWLLRLFIAYSTFV